MLRVPRSVTIGECLLRESCASSSFSLTLLPGNNLLQLLLDDLHSRGSSAVWTLFWHVYGNEPSLSPHKQKDPSRA